MRRPGNQSRSPLFSNRSGGKPERFFVRKKRRSKRSPAGFRPAGGKESRPQKAGGGIRRRLHGPPSERVTRPGRKKPSREGKPFGHPPEKGFFHNVRIRPVIAVFGIIGRPFVFPDMPGFPLQRAASFQS
ncbi:MAG: hypothetical protein BAA03_11565 [Caldibacillus debilis]|nr:MAG: hypothetical protein BAA03_11565 [Caldibacillus debilis]